MNILLINYCSAAWMWQYSLHFTCKTTSTSYEFPLLFWCPRNCEPLYRSEVVTPGCCVLIGGGGISEAEDRRAATGLPQHSVRTGMMSASASVSPTATVMNLQSENSWRKKGYWPSGPPVKKLVHPGTRLALPSWNADYGWWLLN